MTIHLHCEHISMLMLASNTMHRLTYTLLCYFCSTKIHALISL